MNIILEPNRIKSYNIIYLQPVKNTIIQDSNFIRIMYSNKFATLNGIHIRLFNNVNRVISIEKMILNNYELNKTPVFNMYYRFINHSGINSIVKISGIWETSTEYGLTFKVYYPPTKPSVIK